MKQALQIAVAMAVGVSGTILLTGAGLWLLLRALIGSMNAEAVTTVLWLVIVLPVVTAGGVFAFVRALWNIKHQGGRAEADPNWDMRSIEPRPPLQITPPPLRVNVPLHRSMGKPEPLGARKVELQSTLDGDVLEIPLDAARKFAQLDTPARNQWTGDRGVYGVAAKWFAAHGLLDRTPKGGYTWVTDYDEPARLDWLNQFNP